MRAAFARLPIRVRLTLAFAGVMGVLLLAGGVALRLTLAHELNQALDQSLRARAVDVAASVVPEGRPGPGRPSPLTERGERYAQVIDPGGRIVDATPLVRRRPLIDAAALRRGLRRSLLTTATAPPDDSHLRVLTTPVEAGGRTYALVIGTPLAERDGALENLSVLLIIGGPVTVFLASLAGYGVARAALEPVESMRRRAAEISGSEPGARLPVPEARDEVRRLGETLNEMLERVEAALERERTFVADASHELRTPLTILRAELELANSRPRDVAELRRAVAGAGEEAERLARLADDLLVVARADGGGLPVRPDRLEAAELLESVRDRLALRAAEGGRVVAIDAPEGLELAGDRLRLEQAVGNLLDNALWHGAGRITLGARRENGSVELWVHDEGPGFPSEFLPRAFDRFSRADPARGRGGAGLGLAIVQAIARAHGGEAWAANPPGGGGEAGISLPAGVSRPAAPGSPRPDRLPA